MMRRSPRNNPSLAESPAIPTISQHASSAPRSVQPQIASTENNVGIEKQGEQNAPSTPCILQSQGQSQAPINHIVASASNFSEAHFVPNGPSVYNTPQSQNIVLSDSQFRQLLGGMTMRQESKSTFSSCTARFTGARNSANVEDFLATIQVYKDTENISDFLALTSLPLLLEGYASTWWQGVQDEARDFNDAIELLRKAFAPVKPDWRIFNEIFQEKQKSFESTDAFICRKRRLFAQLSEKLSEKTILNMIFGQLNFQIRGKLSRDNINTFQDLLQQSREIEMTISENKYECREIKPNSQETPISRSYVARTAEKGIT